MDDSLDGDDLSPEDIERTIFSITENGYDRDEVEVFLRATAAEIRALLQYKSQRPYAALGREMGALMQQAHDAAAHVRKDANTEGARILQEAHRALKRAKDEVAQLKRQAQSEASMIREEAIQSAERIKEQAEKTLGLAEAEASLMRQDFHRAARRVKEEAKQKAAEIRAAAEADAHERTRESERRLRRLQEAEMTMRNRIDDLASRIGTLEQEAESAPAPEGSPDPESRPAPNIGITDSGTVRLDEQSDETVR